MCGGGLLRRLVSLRGKKNGKQVDHVRLEDNKLCSLQQRSKKDCICGGKSAVERLELSKIEIILHASNAFAGLRLRRGQNKMRKELMAHLSTAMT